MLGVWGCGFYGSGLRVLEFMVQGFCAWSLGLRVLRFRIEGFRVYGSGFQGFCA